jgi:hypothetical protein
MKIPLLSAVSLDECAVEVCNTLTAMRALDFQVPLKVALIDGTVA